MRTIPSARALLIDPRDRVLLMRLAAGHIALTNETARAVFWVTPGGSLHDGETFEAALAREIREETGLHLADPGRWVWTGEKELTRAGERVLTVARVYAQRVAGFDPSPTALTAEEQSAFRGFQWWSADEIAASRDRFVPRALATLLRDLLDHAWPEQPISIDV